MIDIDPFLMDGLKLSPENIKAFEYYKKNSLSIELVKDDILQKVNFRVKNKSVLRDEVKEKLKWNVDRTSPSNKIRDLMNWTRDIMRDISYQRKILDHPISKFFTKGWLVWNYGAIVLSLAINIIMLVTWSATSFDDCNPSVVDTHENASIICPGLYDSVPTINRLSNDEYKITLWVLGGVHNLFSFFVLISYFLSYHPRLPKASEIKNWLFQLCGKSSSERDQEETKNADPPSKLNTQFFSFTTFYYLLFLGMSIAGNLYHGYFFAFHLLNIVNNNQLLGGVIKAVTQNGMSLLWVAVLGFVVIYIYALIGFALLRVYFKNESALYCSTLWQCTVTVIRFGLIGDMFEEIRENPAGNSFSNFWPLVIYHVSFFIFITTIGLNIIFGIIVDTFSELRDLKWRAESDMKDTCFICSRNSYDFEHHGRGFDHHVALEHNMWSYVYFILHLDDIKASDYTALELYVAKLMEKENYEFMPLNRALCLSSIDIDSTESKIDELLSHVMSISKKQKEEEAEKKRQVEKRKQKRWQEKHRGLILGTEADSEREPLAFSRCQSMTRSILALPSRSQSKDQLSQAGDQPSSDEPPLIPLATGPTLPASSLTLPSGLPLHVPHSSPLPQQHRADEDDTDIGSVTDSESGSYHLHSSYDLLDEELPTNLPSYPPLSQAPPSDQFTTFPPPPSLPPTPSLATPQVMFYPSSAPSSPRSPATQFEPRTDEGDDTRPGSNQIIERL